MAFKVYNTEVLDSEARTSTKLITRWASKYFNRVRYLIEIRDPLNFLLRFAWVVHGTESQPGDEAGADNWGRSHKRTQKLECRKSIHAAEALSP